MIIVVPQAPPPPPPPGVDTVPLSWSWTAPWMDQTWQLTDWSSPVIKLKGATGTGQGDPEHWWAEAPTLDGSEWDGVRIARGELFLPLLVRGADSADFLVQHELFRRALDPKRVSVVRVTRPDGSWREAACRYQSGGDFSIDVDPVAACRARYGITWALADPYWFGAPVEATFTPDPGAPFFPGPPFSLSRGLTINDARITNPGDVESHPVWRVWGPFKGFSVGIGDDVVGLTVTRSAGQWVEVDMRPRKLTVLDDTGFDCWSAMDTASFSEIPPGVDLPLAVSVVDPGATSQVDLTFTPRYRAAW